MKHCSNQSIHPGHTYTYICSCIHISWKYNNRNGQRAYQKMIPLSLTTTTNGFDFGNILMLFFCFHHTTNFLHSSKTRTKKKS